MAEINTDGKRESAPKFCTSCGAPLEDGLAFCTSCGAPVPTAPEEEGPQAASDEVVVADQIIESGIVDEEVSTPDSSPKVEPQPMSKPRHTVETTAVLAPEPQQPVEAADAPVPELVAKPEPAAPKRRSKTPLIVAGTALVAVAATAGIFLLTQPQAPASAPQGSGAEEDPSTVVIDGTEDGEKEEKVPERIVVELTEKYTTRFEDVNMVTYPPYQFKFPSNWEITEEDVSLDNERVVLQNQDGVSIEYNMSSAGDSNAVVELKDVEVMADGAFFPGYIQANDLRYIGPSVVVKGVVAIDGKEQEGVCYALVSKRSLGEGGHLEANSGAPEFDHDYGLVFVCHENEELDAQTEQEVIAILASFEHASHSSASAGTSAPVRPETPSSSDYILSESDSRVYSEQELSELSNYELYLARNEIYARHGRIFQNEDLQAHFGEKSWYNPSIAPSDFSESLLNSTEKANITAMKNIEQARGSEYL